MIRQAIAAVLIVGSLTACTAAQIDTALNRTTAALARVQEACALASPLAQMAMVLPVAGPYIALGVQVGCNTADGIARLAADPSSADWLKEQAAMLRDALVRARML